MGEESWEQTFRKVKAGEKNTTFQRNTRKDGFKVFQQVFNVSE